MRSGFLVCTLALVACGDNAVGENRQGGELTVDDRSMGAYGHPAPTLDILQLGTHQAGRGPFAFHWNTPQLGPLFNNDACFGCHSGMGRGESQIEQGPFGSQALVRISQVAGTPDVPNGPVPVPGFGLQLQDHATVGLPEVFVTLSYGEFTVAYGDGELQAMRAPALDVRRPDGTPMPVNVRYSYRQAPGVFGLGLLEAIPDATLLELADPDDTDGDGISGRPNLVWSGEAQAERIGRFGAKANVANLREQTAGAFVNDMGLTNKLFPEPDGMRDVNDEQLDQTTFFVSTLAVPIAGPRNAAAARGRELFETMQCAGCHIPTLETGEHPIAPLAHQVIHPYADLLIHDMGDELTDSRQDFTAIGEEWRTPPLWGLGLVQVVDPLATFLHDGRARTFAEAILWHGGEAAAASEAFRTADKRDRAALIAFLQSL